MATAAHVVVYTVLERAAARASVRVWPASLLRARLETLADQVHILRVLLDLRVRGLLKDVILTVVNLVQQVLIVDP